MQDKTTLTKFLGSHIDQKIDLGMLRDLWYSAYFEGYTDKLHKKGFQPFKREDSDDKNK